MVAWEKQIEEHCVPAWRDKYVAYGRLKRKLDRLKAAETEFERTTSLGGPATKRPWATSWAEEAGPAQQSLEQLLDASEQAKQEEFLEEVHVELERVSDWYSETVTALESRVRALANAGGSPGNAVGLRPGLANSKLEPPEEVAQLHLEAVRLTEYVRMNAEALRKIVKKMDKQCGTKYQKDFVERHLKKSKLASGDANAPFSGERARTCRRELEKLVSPEMLETLRSQAMTAGGVGLSTMNIRPRRVAVSVALAVAAMLLACPAFPTRERAQRCVALVTFTVSMWVSEAAPFEATAMLVAPLGVTLSVLDGPKKDQAKRMLGVVFNDSLYLVLSGFVMSSVFSRCQLDCRAAAQLQRWLGNRPFLFMLALMFLGTGLSGLLSNVTAPLLLVEVIKPMIRDMPTDSRYSRALLLGLAFSCNIGGMITPISSPQNVAALETLRQQGGTITWAQWLSVSLPFCAVMEVLAWALLLLFYRVDLSEEEAGREQQARAASAGSAGSSAVKARAASAGSSAFKVPPVVFEKEDLTVGKVVALLGASTTLTIYACAPVADFFGGTSSVALLFVAVNVGTGAISRQAFNSYSWHLLFLIGGGNALGLAVRESGLLEILAGFARQGLADSPWLLVSQLVLVLVGATTFVSHTVAALVLMPLVVELGSAVGVADLAVLVGALACSAACALPMTSFPNVNSLMALDDHGKPWLSARHFLAAGTPMTVLTTLMLVTLGFGLAELVLHRILYQSMTIDNWGMVMGDVGGPADPEGPW